MSGCEQLVANASLGVSPALRAVDCLAGEMTATAFGRLFGGGQGAGGGALAPVLTIVLTLYIAFFAIALLLGRSRLSVSVLSPRMLTLGLVLTFATSWIAYQGVVWNLATGAPDEIAGVLTGAPKDKSATQIFADRIDIVFAAIDKIASDNTAPGAQTDAQAGQQAAQAEPAVSGSFTPDNLMWLAALLLLLGTVGVLVTARIALAALLAVGPIFVVFALFSGTRGLTAGWLRGVVLTAVTPLFVVLGGGITIELMVPVIRFLGGPDGINGRAAVALFLIAAVHVALMVMIMKVAGTMVAGWQVFGLAGNKERKGQSSAAAAAPPAPVAATLHSGNPVSRRMAMAAATVQASEASAGLGGSQPDTVRERRTVIAQPANSNPALPPVQQRRTRGIGSRFAAPAIKTRESIR